MSNGTQALEFFKDMTTSPEIIICDLDMSEMDGIQLLQHLTEYNFLGEVCMFSGIQTTTHHAGYDRCPINIALDDGNKIDALLYQSVVDDCNFDATDFAIISTYPNLLLPGTVPGYNRAMAN
ncbi:hypothetical protein CCP3SC15_1910003 [Gammaproteobacteria bacterium]